MPIALKPFDPTRDFVAQTFFRAGGVIWKRKQPFDKSFVNERVLRQLYEARKIAYAADVPPEPPIAIDEPGDDTPVEQHETEVAAQEAEINEGATEAAEAPAPDGESPSPDAAAPPPDETTPDAAKVDAPAEAEAAADPDGEAAPAVAADPLDHDKDGEKGGSLPDNTGTREELIKRLVNRHTHDALFDKASGLKGVTKSMTKAEIAAALVDAGRVDDGTA